jgi:hypothetical protein
MIEAKLRVKLTKLSNVDTHFYGKITSEKVVEDTMFFEKDIRSVIAPFGIKATIAIDHHYDGCEEKGSDIFEININKYYFEEDVVPNTYHCCFAIDGKMYDLGFGVKDDQIKDLTLCEWASVGDFEDGDDPMFYYYKDEFREYFKMYL